MPILIGIAGGSASGKTTLAKELANQLGPERVLYLLQDYYYRELPTEWPLARRALYNFDHPDAFETPLLCEHLDLLLAGETVAVPDYDYGTHLRKPDYRITSSRDIILLDGILALHEPALRARMSHKVFVECPAEVRLARRIERDVNERRREEADVIRQFTTQVEPMHQQFVEPSKEFAEVVVPFAMELRESVNQVLAALRAARPGVLHV